MSSDTPASSESDPTTPPAGVLRIDPTAVEGYGYDDVEVDGSVDRRRRTRRWLKIALWTIIVVAGYYMINLIQVHVVANDDQARPVDAIVVMGAAQYDGRPSPVLQSRLDHVVILWNEGLAPLIVVTGGNQPGDRFTEAEASADYLVANGVDPAAIISEDQGRSSWESLSAVAAMLDNVGAQTVLLVSDPYHMLRVRLMAQELGLTAYVSPTRTSTVSGSAEIVREIKEAAGVAIGRIIGFDRLLSITG